MLRSVILAAARSPRVARLVETAPISRDVVKRFVAGTSTHEALEVTEKLAGQGLAISLDHLGEDTLNEQQAIATKAAYLELVKALDQAGLAKDGRAEVSLKLSALGQAFDEAMAEQNAREICAAADAVGTTVTLDAEDHTTTDSTLDILDRLRRDFPATGAVLQAYLRRTEADCRELATPGSRVRLCKGALVRPGAGQVRVPDAVWGPAGGAAPPRGGGLHGPGLCAVRDRVVWVPHAPLGRKTGKYFVLRALVDLQKVGYRPGRVPRRARVPRAA